VSSKHESNFDIRDGGSVLQGVSSKHESKFNIRDGDPVSQRVSSKHESKFVVLRLQMTANEAIIIHLVVTTPKLCNFLVYVPTSYRFTIPLFSHFLSYL
jgi:nitrite reductase/ring-hydroxylating ferredoxin subunit